MKVVGINGSARKDGSNTHNRLNQPPVFHESDDCPRIELLERGYRQRKRRR